MSVQRRRGQSATVYISKEEIDSRGNKHRVVDLESGIPVRAAFIPQRSARAEVPGQQDINVTRMILTNQVPGLDLWGRVHWRGSDWDIVTPPSYHHGTRGTRHYSVDIRERP